MLKKNKKNYLPFLPFLLSNAKFFFEKNILFFRENNLKITPL